MAEALGTALAVVGVLGQLFDGCVRAYGYFTAAANLDQDSQRMLCKVRIEEMRLVVWGREWGVAEGRLEAHLDSESQRNPQLRELALQILRELHATVSDFRKLKDRYGLVDEAGVAAVQQQEDEALAAKAAAALAGSYGGGNGKELPIMSGKGSKKMSTNGRSWSKDMGLRAKWVITDKDKFTKLLVDLKDFNDGLERLFPPSQLPSLQRAWTHQLLESAQRDIAQLSLLENASDGIYPKLTASTKLKKLRINLDAKPQASFKPTFAMKVPRAALDLGGGGGSEMEKTGNGNGNGNGNDDASQHQQRCQAHHEVAGDVIVEWVDYDREDIDERVAHVRRLDDLARMMHSASECHPDLHSIDCVGYTDDSANSRYGLVYKAPSSSFSTLHALMSSPDLHTPDLNDRVDLARTLAVALWSLHSLDWLHKSLCGANILFFPSAFSTSATSPTAAAALVPDIRDPYLTGFDASRPDLDTALSVVPRNPSIADLHRHPGSIKGRPHCKSFDIYSLGLVLLEIGLWKALQTYHKAHYSAARWRDKVVLAVLVPSLGKKMGRRYREVVEVCLTAGEDMTGSEAGKLMESVVTKLESIRV